MLIRKHWLVCILPNSQIRG